MKIFSVVMPYLLLVSFSSGSLNNFALDKINMINSSPYNAVALPLTDVYDTARHSEKDFDLAINLLKTKSTKHVWPWIFFNRFIGYKEDGIAMNPNIKKPYFKNVKGVDIYNETGALGDFYTLWRIALRQAKQLGSPGIVVDQEAYNNYRTINLAYIAQEQGRSEEAVKSRLKAMGAELIDITEQEYSQATLWFLFTWLGQSEPPKTPFGEKRYRTYTYIVIGMLERAKEINSKIKIVSGGELSLGYCYTSLNDMIATINKRDDQFKPFTSLYPNLFLAGTIAPWDDVSLKKDWLLKGKCGESTLSSIADFKPLYRYLFNHYRYVWIYAASNAGYNPYDSNMASKYNMPIEDIKNEQ